MEGSQNLTDDILKSKCRLCGETTKRKNYFFSDSGKALQLKRIILIEYVKLKSQRGTNFQSFVAEVAMIKFYFYYSVQFKAIISCLKNRTHTPFKKYLPPPARVHRRNLNAN